MFSQPYKRFTIVKYVTVTGKLSTVQCLASLFTIVERLPTWMAIDLTSLWLVGSENTHLFRKGKYHCTADLLFERLGFGQTSKSVSIQQNNKFNK